MYINYLDEPLDSSPRNQYSSHSQQISDFYFITWCRTGAAKGHNIRSRI
jgi:hypothetical protein